MELRQLIAELIVAGEHGADIEVECRNAVGDFDPVNSVQIDRVFENGSSRLRLIITTDAKPADEGPN